MYDSAHFHHSPAGSEMFVTWLLLEPPTGSLTKPPYEHRDTTPINDPTPCERKIKPIPLPDPVRSDLTGAVATCSARALVQEMTRHLPVQFRSLVVARRLGSLQPAGSDTGTLDGAATGADPIQLNPARVRFNARDRRSLHATSDDCNTSIYLIGRGSTPHLCTVTREISLIPCVCFQKISYRSSFIF